MRPWQLELVAPQGQAIRARSALRPQGAKLLRARARLPIYHGLLSAAFLLCTHSSSNWLPRRGKLFGHAVPCARRAQNSLGRAKFTKILCSKQLLRSIQDFSARRANALLGRNNGVGFHIVRCRFVVGLSSVRYLHTFTRAAAAFTRSRRASRSLPCGS